MGSVETGQLPADRVRRMFDRIAPVYDLMNRVMTAGLDRRWRRVTVAERDGEIVGVIVLEVEDGRLYVDNVAVDPRRQGTGVGRALLERAETVAREDGFDRVYLYTHELMSENLALYARIGYVEYERRQTGWARLVHLYKPLG